MKTATLRVISSGSELTVEAGRSYVVGRSQSADVVIDDSRVSRRHLIIEPTDAGWAVRDVSANGTWVDGRRVETIDVQAQVRLRLGTPTGPEVVVTADVPQPGPGAPVGGPNDAEATVVLPYSLAEPAGAPVADTGMLAAPVGPPAPQFAVAERPNWMGEVSSPGPTAKAASRRRRRWPWITVLVLLIIGVAVDRIGVIVATHQVVHQVQTSQKLASKPQATIGGFPFLSQVAFGKYSDVSVKIRDLTTPGPRIQRIAARLKGVHVPLGTALSGKVKRVPVDRIEASVFVAFADLNGYLKGLPGGLQIGANGSGLQLTGQAPGLDLAAGALMAANLDVGSNDFTIKPGDLGGLALPLPPSILSQLTTKIPMGVLPFNLRLVSVKVHSDSIEFAASASNVVLPGPS